MKNTVSAKIYREGNTTYSFDFTTGILKKYVKGRQKKQRTFSPGSLKNLYGKIVFNEINPEDIL